MKSGEREDGVCACLCVLLVQPVCSYRCPCQSSTWRFCKEHGICWVIRDCSCLNY